MKSCFRTLICTIMVFLFLVTISGCGGKNDIQSTLTEKDFTLAGISLDATKDEVKKAFGEPSKILQMSLSERWNYGKTLFFEFVDGRVRYIEIFKEGKTARGLGIGDKKNKVLELYGKPALTTPIEDNKVVWIYTWQDKVDLKITITPDDTVEYIGLWTNY